MEELGFGEGVDGHSAVHEGVSALIGHSRDGASTRALVSYTTSSKPSSEDMVDVVVLRCG